MAPFTAKPPAAQLLPLAELCRSLRGTRKRLEKAELVGRYLATLAEHEAALACRYLTASPFAARDPRVLRLGPAAVMAALVTIEPRSTREHLARRLVALGELTEVAAEALAERPGTGLTLAQGQAALLSLAAPALKPKQRTQALADLLARACGLEAGLLVGIAMGELRLGLSTDALLDALARWHERPPGEVQRLWMLTGDVGEVALLLRSGQTSVPLVRYRSLGCMLATPFDLAGERALDLPLPCVAQDKFDGIRAQVHIGPEPAQHGGEMRPEQAGAEALPGVRLEPQAGGPARRLVIFSRTHDDVTHAFPELWQPLADALPAGRGAGAHGVLDGELLAYRDGRPLPFVALQARLGRKAPTEALQAEVPVAYVAFDLLARDQALRLDEPLGARLAELAAWLVPNARAWLADSPSLEQASELEGAFAAARARGHEGLLLKDPASPYLAGKRGRQWRKVKLPQARFDVVVVSCEVGFGRKREWLSDLTFAVRQSEQDDTLVTIGKAYSGLTDRDLEQLTPWFHEHTRQVLAHGRVRLVEPNVVLEVACDRVQRSKRHKGGYALRFARIVAIRRDKAVADIDTLTTVAEHAE